MEWNYQSSNFMCRLCVVNVLGSSSLGDFGVDFLLYSILISVGLDVM